MNAATLIDVLPQHAFDQASLWRYLSEHLAGFTQPATLRQFQGGQSNPTFLVECGDEANRSRYVLRKKPPGRLLPSAHLVEREFRVFRALEHEAVPVPRTHLLCEDAAIIGTPFFVMDYVPGRVMTEVDLPGLARADRTAVYENAIATLAAIHRVDWQARGLSDFGKPQRYVARQVERWSSQYLASKSSEDAAMDALCRWLRENVPADEETSIVHGDFRMGNLMLHPQEPRVVAVLDWELATLGHPLGDLAYFCMFYRFPPDGPLFAGLAGRDLEALGIPDESQVVAAYCRRMQRSRADHWPFFLAFSFFRLAAIAVGVHARALQGNAADRRALEHGELARTAAGIGWTIAREAGP